MRVLVIGAGATGGYFGARLTQAGRDVTFLVRPPRADQLAERGLRVRDTDGHVDRVDIRTVTHDRLTDNFDIVLVAVKAYALPTAITDFSPAVGPHTAVIPFLNGMKHIDKLTAAFGPTNVYGGVLYLVTELADDGDVVHLGGKAEMRYGPLAPGDARAGQIHEALSGAGFQSDLSTTIEADMWEKWVYLASVTAVTCLMRGTVGDVTAVPGGTDLATAIGDEATAVATAAGFPPRPEAAKRLFATLTAPGAPTTSSVYRDLRQGRRLENEAVISDLVRRARALEVPTPLLAATDVNLAVYRAP
ncbi:ketopantoate reductase family protein [Asanoa sp. NPDC050611]|uniref:ketopantoate reductase family protein n=1 Tax=Asanoa sp. NPDC050611 TaxID=3157098 RepID=UPI00340A55FB